MCNAMCSANRILIQDLKFNPNRERKIKRVNNARAVNFVTLLKIMASGN